MAGQLAEHPLDHGLLDDGQHLLGGGQGQGPETRALAAHQDDGSHFVVPPELFAVWRKWWGRCVVGIGMLVVGLADVVVPPRVLGARLDCVDEVELDLGRGLGNGGGGRHEGHGDQLAVGEQEILGIAARLRCPSFDSKLGQLYDDDDALLAGIGCALGADVAVGVGPAHPGSAGDEVESSRPCPYSHTNLPSVALLPDSELFFGAMVMTPVPSVVKPDLAGVGAGRQVGLDRAADVDAQAPRARPAAVVGWPADDAV